jgi:Uma2 family endonuclease
VVCDPAKLDERGCVGAPDMIVEVSSPSNASYDSIVKYKQYEDAGVKEYWIVNPEYKTIMVCILQNGRYVSSLYDEHDTVSVTVLPGLSIAVESIFPKELYSLYPNGGLRIT